ncbi:MAG: hypothetical protein ACNA8W_23725 [Bradymonadaceae bacterium]
MKTPIIAGLITMAMIFFFSVPQAFAQRVIEFEEIVVEGRIQKPEAFYILQHASLSYERLNPKPSFLDELLETVEEEPF